MKRICASLATFALVCTMLCSQAFAAGKTVSLQVWGDYPEYVFMSVTNVVAQEELPYTFHGSENTCDYLRCENETVITALDVIYDQAFMEKYGEYGVEPINKYIVSYAPWDGNKTLDMYKIDSLFDNSSVFTKTITLPEGKWVVCYYYDAGHLKEDGSFAITGGCLGYVFVEVEKSSQAPQTAPKFTDVAAEAYYADPVTWAVEKGITSGTSSTTFSPNDTCTRAQIMTFLWRAAGSPEPKGTATVTDVKASDYFYKAVLWAAENKMFSGTAFAPGEPCTRAMAVEFMWKQAGSPSASSSAFTDVPSDASYASAVSWALDKGVTAGTSKTTFSPDTACSRGQIVTFLYRGMK